MKKGLWIGAAAITTGCLIAVSAPTWADSVTLYPVIDAYGDAGPNSYFDAALWVENGTGSNKIRTYTKFDLSSIPEGSTIDSAILKLYLTQVPVGQTGSPPRPTSSQSYELSKSTNVSWNTSTVLFTGVALGSDLVAQATGTTVDTDVAWTGANLQTAVQQSLDSATDNNLISLVVRDLTEGATSSARRQGRFASNETASGDATRPRLMVEYTPPAAQCQPGDEELRLVRSDYLGVTPIPWDEASLPHWFTVRFTLAAICAEITDIKLQGGIASNLEIFDVFVTDGYDDPVVKSVGKGNQVLTWYIDSLSPEDGEVELWFDVSATLNGKGKPACGVKNLTGDWSARGFWDDGGVPQLVTDAAGQLVVEIECPVAP